MIRRVALLILPFMLACGYQSGQVTGGDGRSIAIPVVINRTYRRDLERDLTRALHEEVRSRTRYRLVGESDDPDLLLTTALTRVSESVLSERDHAELRESSIQVSAHITVLDRRTGETILDNVPFQERRSFAPLKGESIRTAELAAMRALAERIVYSLADGW